MKRVLDFCKDRAEKRRRTIDLTVAEVAPFGEEFRADGGQLADVWPQILKMVVQLKLNAIWKAGKCQIFTSIYTREHWFWDTDVSLEELESPKNVIIPVGDRIYLQKIHYNSLDDFGVFAHWHAFLTAVREKMEEDGLDYRWSPLKNSCTYWSTASNKVHSWHAVQ